jgi:hypothetical protein
MQRALGRLMITTRRGSQAIESWQGRESISHPIRENPHEK